MKRFLVQYIGQKRTEILTALGVTQRFKDYLYFPLVNMKELSSITIKMQEYKVLIKPLEGDNSNE